jgi:predicted adenine nucleotide alpha hydrolase (AANH) superfamily ATPase
MEEEREEVALEEEAAAAVIAPPPPTTVEVVEEEKEEKQPPAATVDEDVDEKLEDANPIPESTLTTTLTTSNIKNASNAKQKLVKELASHNSAREPELKTGKRERKKTEFLSATLLQSPEKKKHEQDKKVQKEGEGSKLRDIENVKFAMDKMKR